MSNINVSIENPYGEVRIPRAQLHPSDDGTTVIANPMALSADGGNPYAASGAAAPPPYVVKEVGGDEEEGRSRACCYRCRRRK